MSLNYLLIGCTGCLGKVILYSLLKNTKDIVYIVIREKEGKTIEERIREIMRVINLDYDTYLNEERIYVIRGEYTKNLELELDKQDIDIIIDKINIFINALADVNFNREIKKSTLNNCKTAIEWLKLYNRCKNVIQYTYVSTAFTGFHKVDKGFKNIEEEFHVNKTQGHTFDMCERTYTNILNGVITENELRNSEFENSYTYSKNLTELLLAKRIHRGKLFIVRPSIIISAVQEPYPSWGSFQTINLFILGIVSGMSLFYCMDYNNCVLNTVPVDMVARDCIRVIEDESKESVKILHSCLTHNSCEWYKDKEVLYNDLSNYIYLKYSLEPLNYKNKVYYPSVLKIYKNWYECYIGMITLLIRSIIVNISRFGIINGIMISKDQFLFTWKYNQLFHTFANKNCCFKRSMEIDSLYLSISYKDVLYKFIDNIPELLKTENISWL